MSSKSLAVLASVALLVSGCSLGGGPEFLQDFTGPSDAFWQLAEENPGEDGTDGILWLLPLAYSFDIAMVDEEAQSASHWSTSGFNPGLFVIPMLPLWFSLDRNLYTRDGKEMHNGMVWTPFYCGSTTHDWPDDRARFSSAGVPLFYWNVRQGNPPDHDSIALHQFLWTLGPLYLSVDDWRQADAFPPDADVTTGTGVPSGVDGFAFLPLFAGGFGGILWTSYDFELAGDRIINHGPVAPFNIRLGFSYDLEYNLPRNVENREEAIAAGVESSETTQYVTGILWGEYEDRDASGEVIDARYGPLWGMLGWGRSDGEPCIRFFWFPIKV